MVELDPRRAGTVGVVQHPVHEEPQRSARHARAAGVGVHGVPDVDDAHRRVGAVAPGELAEEAAGVRLGRDRQPAGLQRGQRGRRLGDALVDLLEVAQHRHARRHPERQLHRVVGQLEHPVAVAGGERTQQESLALRREPSARHVGTLVVPRPARGY